LSALSYSDRLDAERQPFFALLPVWKRQNLMFGLNARRVSTREANYRIGEILRTVGLESRAAAKPHQLSGGEQQRVALARAPVLRPSILLMDEPLSNLDEDRKQTIAREILDLHKQFGLTLIYVTHDRLEANALASRICGMSEGRLSSFNRK
jgi:ABC-type Fe3+/spermidine/putrescine transport system ATPase subunit